ncbi:MAG: hypothetical protein GX621_18060, partial [Pirellulaceae bacterium]|nr:hypothetical protein [Pirellulaceae bacterium]
MAINVEAIGLNEGESFRVLRWRNAVDDVELLGFHGEPVPLRGLGSLWHLHEELELTFVAEGSGTRCVGDQISSFETPSLVLLGSNLPHYWRFSGR